MKGFGNKKRYLSVHEERLVELKLPNMRRTLLKVIAYSAVAGVAFTTIVEIIVYYLFN